MPTANRSWALALAALSFIVPLSNIRVSIAGDTSTAYFATGRDTNPTFGGGDGLASPADGTPPLQTIGVEDLVRFAKIGDPDSLTYVEFPGEPAVFSSDGLRAAVVIRRGNPEKGTNDASLLVFQVSQLLSGAKPEVAAEFESVGNFQPVSRVRWLDDGETLVFSATVDSQRPEIVALNVVTRTMRSLVREDDRLLWHDVTRSGAKVVSITELPATSPAQNPECLLRGCLVTARSYFDAESGKRADPSVVVAHDLHAGTRTVMPSPLVIDNTIESCHDELNGGISPDGRFAFRMCRVKAGCWPDWWSKYTVDSELRTFLDRRHNGYGRRLLLLDLQTGRARTFSEAPWVWHQAPPIWIDNGQGVILVGALEPLGNADEQTSRERASTKAVLSFEPESGRIERIVAFDAAAEIADAVWDQSSERLQIHIKSVHSDETRTVVFVRRKGKWRKLHREVAVQAPTRRINIRVEESLNERPILVAVDVVSETKKVILDPNPWLDSRRIGRVEEITWSSADGRAWRGGLYYPPAYTAGKRYPLLIQTHGFEPNQFSLNGISRNFTGQALAAHDIMVLQVRENLKGAIGGPSEWPTVQDGYESAIDHLSERQLIDRNRVGIHGWSRTGPHAGYTLTHSTYPFAAAAFTDSGDFGWFWYVLQGAPREVDAYYGAAPFGAGMQTWIRYAPTFNLDRVSTPIFMWQVGGVGGLWDWYAGLRRLEKPVEYWSFPSGVHDAYQVSHRLHGNRLLVDWFRFWLKGEEDSAVTKVEQYRRWRELRDLQQRSAARGVGRIP